MGMDAECHTLDANARAAAGGRMTTRKTMVEDMQGVEDILLALDGLHPEMPDKLVIKALARAMWHILEYLVRRAKDE